MKWWTSILLLLLAWTVLLPSAPAQVFVDEPGHEMFSTVDVCHSAAPALSTSGDMPCINEAFVSPVPSVLTTLAEQVRSSLIQLLLSSQDGHPPKA